MWDYTTGYVASLRWFDFHCVEQEIGSGAARPCTDKENVSFPSLPSGERAGARGALSSGREGIYRVLRMAGAEFILPS